MDTKLKFKHLLCFITAIIAASSASGAVSHIDLNFHHIGLDSGLSQMQINGLYQDEFGMLWIGTKDGVKFYDGNKVFPLHLGNNKNWTLSNFVPTICGDGHGHLFINTNYTIYEYNLEFGTYEKIYTQEDKSIAPALAFHYGESNLWIGLHSNIFKYDGNKLEHYAQLQEPDVEISSLTAAGDLIYAGTKSSGLWEIKANGENRQILSSCSEIVTIFHDDQGTIWCGSLENGLFGIFPDGTVRNYNSNNRNCSLASNFVRAISQDDNGNLWIGTSNGLNILDINHESISRYGLSSNNHKALSNLSVWTILKDSNGTMWLGSYYGGLDYCNVGIEPYKFVEIKKTADDAYSLVSDIVKDKAGNLWIGTEGNGLAYMDRAGKCSILAKTPVSSFNIKCLMYDTDKNCLWIGTHQGGLWRFDAESGQYRCYNIDPVQRTVRSQSILDIESSGENLYIGTLQGVFRMHKTTEEIKPVRALNAYLFEANKILISKLNGKIWVAGNNLCSYDPNTDSVKEYGHVIQKLTGETGITMTTLYENANGELYIGTSGHGVIMLDTHEGQSSIFNTANSSIAGNYISSILGTSDGNLLIGTNSGLSWLDIKNKRSLIFNISNSFPLHSMIPGCITEGYHNGELVFGGINGLIMTTEQKLLRNYLPSIMFFSGLIVNNKRIAVNDGSGILNKNLRFVKGLELKHNQNNITIELGLNNPTQLSQPLCRYKLEGINRDWIPHSSNMPISYTNLPYGNYVLKVMYETSASNTDCVSLPINIRPPFYASWYAYILYFVFGIGIIAWSAYFFYSRLKLRTSVEIERNKKEQSELVNNQKLRFFGNMSHELRTPLTLIIGQLELFLSREDVTNQQKDKLQEVLEDSRRMKSMVNEQLDMLKLDQGALKLVMSDDDIVNLAEKSCMKFKNLAALKKISLEFLTETPSVVCRMDSLQMGRVFYNLLSNAFKYTKPGGHVIFRIRTPKNNTVTISVSDDGIGIPKNLQEKIFERFYQVENEVNKDFSQVGSGIGLSFTKSIIEAHSGNISVSSEEGHGSTFSISFPCQCISDKNSSEIYELPSGHPAHKSIYNRRKKALLVVEDEPDVRKMISSIFNKEYEVYGAENGVEGLKMAMDMMPDIIISDVMMPIMSGFEFCRKIKTNFDTSHIPVILLTALSDVDNNIEGLGSGADDYVTKPFNIRLLQAKCHNILANRALMQSKFLKEENGSCQIVSSDTKDNEFINQIVLFIEESAMDGQASVALLCKKTAMSHTRLFSKVKGITGQSPQTFIQSVKLKLAARLLREHQEMNISEISDKLGFSSINYFGKCFKVMFGMSPSSYRKLNTKNN